MKAALFQGNGAGLVLTDVPVPVPGPGEVRLKVAGCGLCHTDLHYLDHGVKPFKTPPLILGHEIAGTVDALGSGVTNPAVGTRVLVPSVLSCGRCGYCRQGRENLCSDLVMLGNNIDGGYAEYVVVPAHALVRVPDSIPLEHAAVIADALSTPYHAVKNRGRIRPGQTVAVVGCGGVGLNLVQCATLAGGRVIAIDLNPERLRVATELGAVATFNPSRVERIDKAIKQETGGGVDVAFEAIGNPATMQVGYNLLRRGGRLVVVGYSHDDLAISAARLMYYELEVIGSLGCGAGEYPEIIALVEAGRLRLDPIVSGTLPLAEIHQALDRLRRGEGIRWVITP